MEQFNQSISRCMAAIHRPPLERDAVCPEHGAYVALCHLGKVWTGCPACSQEAEQRREAEEAQRARAAVDAEWQQRLGRAGIPERFMGCSLDNYVSTHPAQSRALEAAQAYASDWLQVRASGRGAIFIGNVGTGKTHLAVAIGLHAMRAHAASVLFISVQRAIRSIKDTWTRGSAMSEGQAIAVLTYPDLLILDEVGVQFGSDYERQVLFDVLNERYECRKPTLFLSNKDADDVRAILGERVWDRLREDGAAIVPFQWASHRGVGGVAVSQRIEGCVASVQRLGGSSLAPSGAGNSSRDVGLLRTAAKGVK